MPSSLEPGGTEIPQTSVSASRGSTSAEKKAGDRSENNTTTEPCALPSFGQRVDTKSGSNTRTDLSASQSAEKTAHEKSDNNTTAEVCAPLIVEKRGTEKSDDNVNSTDVSALLSVVENANEKSGSKSSATVSESQSVKKNTSDIGAGNTSTQLPAPLPLKRKAEESADSKTECDSPPSSQRTNSNPESVSSPSSNTHMNSGTNFDSPSSSAPAAALAHIAGSQQILPSKAPLSNGHKGQVHQDHSKGNIGENVGEHAEGLGDDPDSRALHKYVTHLFTNFWDDRLERVVHPRKGTKLGLQEALGVGLVPKNIRVVQFQGEEPVELTEAVASGQVDRKTGKVVNMNDGAVITVPEAFRQGVFVVDQPSFPSDPQTAGQSLAVLKKELGQGLLNKVLSGQASTAIQVIDRRTGKRYKLHDAVAHSILSVDTAQVKDTVSGKWFSWEDGQRAGVICDPRKLSLHQTLVSPHFHKNLESFSDPSGESFRPLTLEEMIEQDFVDATKLEVFNSQSERWMTVEEAIADNVLDPIQNKYFHKKIGKFISFHDAVDSGLIGLQHEVKPTIPSGSSERHVNGTFEYTADLDEGKELEELQLPVALFKALSTGRVDMESSEVIMSRGRRLSFQSAYERNLLQPEGTFIVDRCTGVVYSFKEAVNCGLVEVKTGSLYDTVTGKKLPLAVAKDQGLIKDTPHPLLPLSVAAEFELFDFEEKKIRHPETKQPLTLTQAIVEGVVDPASQLSAPSGDTMTLQQVITDGSLNLDTLTLTFPDGRSLSLQQCVGVEGRKPPNTYEFGRKMSLTLDEAIMSGVYDPMSNSVRSKGSFITLAKALKSGVINTDSLVRDPFSGDILSLKEALDKRIIDQDCGKMIDADGVPIALNFAMEKGLILKSKAPLNLSLSEALDEGLFNVISNQFLNPDSNEEIDFGTALDQGILDTEFIRVRNTLTGEIVSFDTAVSSGLVDLNSGTCINMEDGEEFSIVDGMDKGIIIDTSSQPAVNLEEALDDGILDVDTCTFKDPYGQFALSLKDAMESGLLNRFSISVRDVKNKSLLSLDGAVSRGLVDSTTGTFRKSEEEELSFKEALEKGLIFSDICVPEKSLLDIVKQGLYNPKTCKFTDPSTGKVRSLKDMVRDSKVDPQLVLVLDKASQQLLTYQEAMNAKILDVKRGMVVDTETGELLDLKEAMGRGLLQENVGNIAVSLKRAVDTGLLQKSHGRIVDPLSRRQLVVEDAINIGLIDVSRLLVKNQDKDIYQFMEESTNDGVVFVDDDSIVYARSGTAVDVVTAFKQNLLVEIPQDGFLLGDILSSGLYDQTHKRFKDPLTSKTLTLTEAISSGVINADLPQVAVPGLGKFSLTEAIDKGLIDPHTGDYIALDKPLSLFDAILTGRVSALSGASPALKKDSEEQQTTGVSLKTSFSQPERSVTDGPNRGSGRIFSTIERNAKTVKSLKAVDMDVLPASKPVLPGHTSVKGHDQETVRSHIRDRNDEADEIVMGDESETDFTAAKMTDSSSNSWTGSPQSSLSEEQMQSDVPFSAQPLLPRMKCHSASNLLDAAAENKRISRDLELASPSLGELHRTSKMHGDKTMVMSDSLMELHSTHWNPPTDELSASLDSLILDAIRKQHIEEKPIPLFDIIKYGIYEERSGMFHDPETDDVVGLSDAVATGLLDASCREVINPNTRQPMSLAEAIQTGVIDAETCHFVDESTGTRLSLQQAVDVGLIFKEKESRQKAVDIYVEEILPDSTSTGRKRLEEAFSTGVLHRSNSQVIDPDSVNAITLRRAASLGLIDVKTGEFRNPQTEECMTLAQAVEKGFILSPKGLTLYGAVNQGLYMEGTGLFQHPSTGDSKTLQELIQDDVVSTLCPEVKDLSQDSIISLGEAIKRGIIDDQEGVYLCKDRSVTYDLTQAVAAGLIVSSSARDGLSDTSLSRSSLSPSPVPFFIVAADTQQKSAGGDAVVPFRKSLSDPGHFAKQSTLSPAGSYSSPVVSSVSGASETQISRGETEPGQVSANPEEQLKNERTWHEQIVQTTRGDSKSDLANAIHHEKVQNIPEGVFKTSKEQHVKGPNDSALFPDETEKDLAEHADTNQQSTKNLLPVVDTNNVAAAAPSSKPGHQLSPSQSVQNLSPSSKPGHQLSPSQSVQNLSPSSKPGHQLSPSQSVQNLSPAANAGKLSPHQVQRLPTDVSDSKKPILQDAETLWGTADAVVDAAGNSKHWNERTRKPVQDMSEVQGRMTLSDMKETDSLLGEESYTKTIETAPGQLGDTQPFSKTKLETRPGQAEEKFIESQIEDLRTDSGSKMTKPVRNDAQAEVAGKQALTSLTNDETRSDSDIKAIQPLSSVTQAGMSGRQALASPTAADSIKDLQDLYAPEAHSWNMPTSSSGKGFSGRVEVEVGRGGSRQGELDSHAPSPQRQSLEAQSDSDQNRTSNITAPGKQAAEALTASGHVSLRGHTWNELGTGGAVLESKMEIGGPTPGEQGLSLKAPAIGQGALQPGMLVTELNELPKPTRSRAGGAVLESKMEIGGPTPGEQGLSLKAPAIGQGALQPGMLVTELNELPKPTRSRAGVVESDEQARVTLTQSVLKPGIESQDSLIPGIGVTGSKKFTGITPTQSGLKPGLESQDTLTPGVGVVGSDSPVGGTPVQPVRLKPGIESQDTVKPGVGVTGSGRLAAVTPPTQAGLKPGIESQDTLTPGVGVAVSDSPTGVTPAQFGLKPGIKSQDTFTQGVGVTDSGKLAGVIPTQYGLKPGIENQDTLTPGVVVTGSDKLAEVMSPSHPGLKPPTRSQETLTTGIAVAVSNKPTGVTSTTPSGLKPPTEIVESLKPGMLVSGSEKPVGLTPVQSPLKPVAQSQDTLRSGTLVIGSDKPAGLTPPAQSGLKPPKEAQDFVKPEATVSHSNKPSGAAPPAQPGLQPPTESCDILTPGVSFNGSGRSPQLTPQTQSTAKLPAQSKDIPTPGALVSDSELAQQMPSALKLSEGQSQDTHLTGVLVSSSSSDKKWDSQPSPRPKRNQRVRFKDLGPEDSDETSSTATTDSTDTLEGYNDNMASRAALRASVQRKGLSLDTLQVASQADSDASTPEAEAQKLTDMLFKLNLKTGSTARERRKVGLHGPGGI